MCSTLDAQDALTERSIRTNVLQILWPFWYTTEKKKRRRSNVESVKCQELRHGGPLLYFKQNNHYILNKTTILTVKAYYVAKKFKMILTRKIMCTVFWDRRGILLVKFMSHGSTMSLLFNMKFWKYYNMPTEQKGVMNTYKIILHKNALQQYKTLLHHIDRSNWIIPLSQPWLWTKEFPPLTIHQEFTSQCFDDDDNDEL